MLDEARRYGFPATVLQPGHIVGPGWIPINPAGNLDPEVFTRLARGDEVTLPWEEWRKEVAEEAAELTWDHIAHSPNASIGKAQRLLNYRPRFSSLEAIHEAVQVLIQKGIVQI